MSELQAVVGYAFKNHGQFHLPLEQNICITGMNGSGKTNILEAVYLGINGILPPDRSIEGTVKHENESGFIKMIFEDTSGIPYETVVSLDGKKKKIQFTLQGSPTTRQKFLAKHRRRAVLFSPIDMNLVYLSPSLRRNFLDEILLLSHHDFQQIRKKYASTLKSRNALLKKFAKHGGNREEIQVWDTLFVELCMIYQDHRDNILSHLQTSLKSKDEKIRKNIQIELIYSSELAKIKKEHRKDYIQNTLHNSLERDILIGHTCIGPHLDDLELNVYTNNKKLHCSELLSRGENKTLLLYLKEFGARYIEKISGAKTYFLLDDIESELDERHFQEIIGNLGERSFALAGIEYPKHLSRDVVKDIPVPENGFQN